MGGTGECVDCERFFPDGEGLTRGRCPKCQADFKARKGPGKRSLRSRRKPKE